MTFALDGDADTGDERVPACGPETMLNVSAPPSGSDPVSVIVSGAEPVVKTVCGFAAGGRPKALLMVRWLKRPTRMSRARNAPFPSTDWSKMIEPAVA